METKQKTDNTSKKIEALTNKVDIIMRNRMIISLFLIIDGISFIFNPNGSMEGMARSIIILVGIAALSTFLANLTSKPRDKKSILISLLIIVLSIILYIYPDLISAYIQLILSAFIICNGLKNIVNTLNLNNKLTEVIEKKSNNIKSNKTEKNEEKEEKFKDVKTNLNDGIEQQKNRLITPLKNIVNKSNTSSKLYIITNIASIILGIILIIFPDVSMVLWGVIFLYTGLTDFIASYKSMDMTNKIKEKLKKEKITEKK